MEEISCCGIGLPGGLLPALPWVVFPTQPWL